MKVEFTFDKEQIQQYGYTVEAVRQTIQKSFAAKGLHLSLIHISEPTRH